MAARDGRIRVSPEHELVISRQQLEDAGISPGDELFISCNGGCISLTKLGPISPSASPTLLANGNGNGNGHSKQEGVQYRY